MATYTSHLNLKLPDYSDTADIKDLNDNFKKIDDAIASGGTETDPTVPAWAKQPSKPTYTAGEVGARPDTWMPSASEVGADASGTAAAQVGAHNVSGAAHADLRALIDGLTSRMNALADSDDTTLDQLSEIVAYIKSNRTLIDAVTTGKVSVSDIVDNLTTNASGKVLSAAQGVALKAMIDGIVIPTALPNPQPITINGQRYDGSDAVTVTTVEIDDTLTHSGKAADAKAVGNHISALNEANAKLKDDLTHKIDNPTTSDNGKIPRAKDGDVEWVEVGQPTDEQTGSAVNNWLNQHPEATTTVQNDSLNELKFTPVARKRIAREYRTLADALSDNIWDTNTIIRTHGFYTFDDGGAGVYMVSSYTPGDGNPMYFDYAENKYLVYVPEDNNINICALGAKRDGSADCSELLNNLFRTIRNVVTKRFYTVIIPNGIFRCDSEISIGVNINIKGINSTRGNYIFEYNSEIYPKENCSILYFPFTDSKTAITVNISQNGMFNIRDIALVSNTTEWKNEGFNTRPTIPYNPFSLTKKVSEVNGLNIEQCSYVSIENCSFVGFSGYGLRTYSHDVVNCFFKGCGSGIINNKSDLMMQHCYITQCDNGIKAGKDGVIWVNNTFIDQCVEHGIYSDESIAQTTLVVNGCIIDHTGYAGIYVKNALDCNIDSRIGRCGMYYAGKTDLSDLSEDEKRKAVSIYFTNLKTGNMRLNIYKRNISDDSSEDTYKLPYVVFGGNYRNLVVTGLHGNDYEFFDSASVVSNTTVYADDGVHTYSQLKDTNVN